MTDKHLQKNFIQEVRRFEYFEIQKYENSVFFDVISIVKKEFGDWTSEEDLPSADDEYAKNYEHLNPEKLFEDEISNNFSTQNMIYFNKENDFSCWLLEMRNKQEDEKIKHTTDIYADFRDVIPNKNDISFTNDDNNSLSDDVSNKGHSNGHRGRMFTVTTDEKRRKNQKEKGNKGELLIYNMLCVKFGKTNVFPYSEAFVELGILKPGQAKSADYDISYKDKNGTEFFIEVKTGNRNFFIISPNELQFARENPNKYKLFLVYNLEKEIPDYVELPKKFWENEKFRKNEIIERIEFEF